MTPQTISVIYQWLLKLLAIISLGSLVPSTFENIERWYGFLKDFFDTYEMFRNELFYWTVGWWLHIEPPALLLDLFILYSCLTLASARWRVIEFKKQEKRFPEDVIGDFPIGLIVPLIALPYLIGSFIGYVRYVRHKKKIGQRRLRKMTYFNPGIDVLCRDLSIILFGLVILLFINWQLLQFRS